MEVSRQHSTSHNMTVGPTRASGLCTGERRPSWHGVAEGEAFACQANGIASSDCFAALAITTIRNDGDVQ